MFYFSSHSSRKIIHTETCCRLKHIPAERLQGFETLEQAYEKHFRLCKQCSPLIRQFREETDCVEKYCQKHAFCVSLHPRFLHIRTLFSQWRLVPSQTGNKLELYHKNTQDRASNGTSRVPGYHFQNVRKSTIQDYLDYIDRHDAFRLKHPAAAPKPAPTKPRKGTRRYKAAQKREKRIARAQAINRVLFLCDCLSREAI